MVACATEVIVLKRQWPFLKLNIFKCEILVKILFSHYCLNFYRATPLCREQAPLPALVEVPSLHLVAPLYLTLIAFIFPVYKSRIRISILHPLPRPGVFTWTWVPITIILAFLLSLSKTYASAFFPLALLLANCSALQPALNPHGQSKRVY